MDVNRAYDGGYQPPVMPGSGEFVPMPIVGGQATEVAYEAPAPVAQEVRVERAEGRESRGDSDAGLRRAVSEINSSITIYRRHLSVRMHEPTNRRIVAVYDSDTNEVLREIPPERVLEAHANMLEMVGLFMDTRG
jgi:flagellar protein FlaG